MGLHVIKINKGCYKVNKKQCLKRTIIECYMLPLFNAYVKQIKKILLKMINLFCVSFVCSQ